MANTIDILTCTHATFLKYLEDSTPKEQTFKDMFSQFNEKYINLSKEIYQINEIRAELLDKIKSAQQEYKRLLGHGEIKPVTDINDDEENEKSTVPEEKVPDKRGRKKVEVKETLNVSKENKQNTELPTQENTELEHESDIDLENIPKMKSKVAKETKKTVKHVEEPEQTVEEEAEVEEQPVVKTTKKTSSQVSAQPTVKKTTKVTKKVEPEAEPEVVVVHEEVKPTASKVKKTVTKSTKKEPVQEQEVEVEPEPEVETVPEVKPKSTKKKTVK